MLMLKYLVVSRFMQRVSGHQQVKKIGNQVLQWQMLTGHQQMIVLMGGPDGKNSDR